MKLLLASILLARMAHAQDDLILVDATPSLSTGGTLIFECDVDCNKPSDECWPCNYFFVTNDSGIFTPDDQNKVDTTLHFGSCRNGPFAIASAGMTSLSSNVQITFSASATINARIGTAQAVNTSSATFETPGRGFVSMQVSFGGVRELFCEGLTVDCNGFDELQATASGFGIGDIEVFTPKGTSTQSVNTGLVLLRRDLLAAGSLVGVNVNLDATIAGELGACSEDIQEQIVVGGDVFITFQRYNCLADINGDGELTPADFSAWIAAFNAGDLLADQNGNGVLDAGDFSR